MFYISPEKLFSFSRFIKINVYFLVIYDNGLIRKIKLISKFMTSHPLVNKQLQYTYCPISQEVRAIKQ